MQYLHDMRMLRGNDGPKGCVVFDAVPEGMPCCPIPVAYGRVYCRRYRGPMLRDGASVMNHFHDTMKNGICLKCGAATVYEVDASGYADGGIAVSSWYSAGLIHYVCVTCGFTEQYVAKKEALAKIAEKKQRVIPRT